jgi:zeta-carotene desaturase
MTPASGAYENGGKRKVIIVGAGIAGMTAALYLIEAGFAVTVLEKSKAVGGKFGAVEGQYGAVHEHAYHFLGDWCVNFWEVVDAIGLNKSDHFRPSKGVRFLRPGDTGAPLATRLSTLELDRLRARFTSSLDNGVIPPDDMMIWFYSLLDLVSHGRDLDEKEFLNRISVNGFMRSLPYMTDLAALLHQEAMMKAFAVPSYETSARSYRQFARFFSRDQDGWILNEAVNQRFWPRFEAALEKAMGASPIQTGSSLETIKVDVDGNRARVSGITLSPATAVNPWEKDAVLLVTVPHGDLAAIVEKSQTLRVHAPRLLELRKLTSRQLASLDVYFRRALPDVPPEHVTLIDDSPFRKEIPDRKAHLATYGNRLASRFGLSFVDNYQAWGRADKADREETWLNVVSADFEELAELSKEDAQHEMLGELRRYLPFDDDDIDRARTDLQSNADRPLFTNTVGSWQYRPEPGFYHDALSDVAFDNLCLAGDYCRSEVDIVCLEGAVLTARRAARAVAEKAGCRERVPEPDVPAEVSPRTVELLKRELEPWLRLAARRSFAARGELGDLRDPLGRSESWKRLLDLWGQRPEPGPRP